MSHTSAGGGGAEPARRVATVISPKDVRLYRGRIGDRAVSPGVQRAELRERDLGGSFDAILAGKPVRERLTKAIACYLPQSAETSAPSKAFPAP